MRFLKLNKKELLLLNFTSLLIVLILIPLFVNQKKSNDYLTLKINPERQLEQELILAHRVIDGDTFIDEHERHIRLIGIDAPEMNYKKGEPECKALKAKLFLKELIEGKKVILKKDKSDKDKYGRLLRYVYLPDGIFVNEELVKRGLAKVKYYKPNISKYDYLKELEIEARNAGIGLHSCK